MGKSEKKKSGRKKRSVLKVILTIFLILILLVLAACGGAVAYFFHITSPMSKEPEGKVEYRIPAGHTVYRVAQDLEELGLIRSWKIFYYGVRLQLFGKDDGNPIKTGFYNLDKSMSVQTIAKMVRTGAPEYLTLTIPEGLTVRKVANLLGENNVCDTEEFKEACKNPELLAEYGIPMDTFEGFLYPDTYYFVEGSSGETVLRKLVDTFFIKANEIPNLKGKTADEIYDTVILASIVEREYKVDSEAPLIAGVFANRLRAHMGLESCATIEYILTEIQGRPHPERIYYVYLKIDSPYNTYMWDKLPPTPISNPGFVALKAAASPADTDCYYFVVKDPDAGTHTFSKTLSEHNSAKSAYLLLKD